jgi:hypothetical protein
LVRVSSMLDCIKLPFDISDKTEQFIWQLCEIRWNVVRKGHERTLLIERINGN